MWLQLEKALLLCALLQGFGMDAYVCSGTVAHKQAPTEKRHWCMTLNAPEGVTFWDAVSGGAPSPPLTALLYLPLTPALHSMHGSQLYIHLHRRITSMWPSLCPALHRLLGC